MITCLNNNASLVLYDRDSLECLQSVLSLYSCLFNIASQVLHALKKQRERPVECNGLLLYNKENKRQCLKKYSRVQQNAVFHLDSGAVWLDCRMNPFLYRCTISERVPRQLSFDNQQLIYIRQRLRKLRRTWVNTLVESSV